MKKIFYLPIKAENLANYFSRACICPANTISNRAQDIQNEYINTLFLSAKQSVGKTDCALEIVLTNDEENKLIPISLDCWLLPKPIPITRIKHILFTDRELMEQIHTVLELNSAFIPKRLLEIVKKFSVAKQPKTKNIDLPLLDWNSKIRNFDQILGGLALMRLAVKDGANFSENYFSMLARYNDVIKQELTNANQKIVSLYKGSYYDKLNKYIISPINQSVVESIAKEENQKIFIDKYSRKINLENLNQASYILAILNDYKAFDFDNGRDNIDGLIINNFNAIKNGEEVAFYFGFNRGYSVFSKKYKDVDFKFHLDTQLDYYTVESVYQKAINGIEISSEFPYLDNWCANKSKDIQSISDSQYIVLDTIVTKKQSIVKENNSNVGTTEWWNSIFLLFLDKIWGLFWEKGKEGLKSGIKEIVEKAIADKMIEIKQSEISKTNNNLNEPVASYQMIQNRIKQLEIINKNLTEELTEKSLKIQELEIQSITKVKKNKPSNTKSIVKKDDSKLIDRELFKD